MKINIIKYFISILLVFLFGKVNGLGLNLVAFTYEPNGDTFFTPLMANFNEYALKNNLDIHINVTLYGATNSTLYVDDFGSLVESLLLKKSKKFDLFVIDTMYSKRFAEHFLDLKPNLPKEHIDEWAGSPALESCERKGRLVTMPLYVDFGILYSNPVLLNKYNKKVPKTWRELIDTAEYILEAEKRENPKSTLLGYLPQMPLYETGYCSELEFIDSFRDKPNSPIPEFNSKNAIEALDTIKEIKRKLNPLHFTEEDPFFYQNVPNGNYVFARNWNIPMGNNTQISRLPGRVEGVTSGTIGGNNIGINRYITEQKKAAALKVIRFLTTKESQKQQVLQFFRASGMKSLYSDADICKVLDCGLFIVNGEMQVVNRAPDETMKFIKYTEYAEKFVKLMNEAITNDVPSDVTMKKIYDINHVYLIDNSSVMGIIITGLTIFVFVLLVISLIIVHIKYKNENFAFLGFSNWHFFLVGLLAISSFSFTGLGEITDSMCQIRPLILSVGFVLCVFPTFLRLISIFPSKGPWVQYVDNNQTLIFIFALIVELILNIIWAIADPIKAEEFYVPESENYQRCEEITGLGFVILIIMIALKALLMLAMSILMFAEWNLYKYSRDIKIFTAALYINVILIITYIIITYVDFNNRYLDFGFKAIIILAMCILNLIIIVGSKVYCTYFYKDKLYDTKMVRANASSNKIGSSSKMTDVSTFDNTAGGASKIPTLFHYHFQTGVPGEQIQVNNSSSNSNSFLSNPNKYTKLRTLNSNINNNINTTGGYSSYTNNS